jgi:hypothetical protein
VAAALLVVPVQHRLQWGDAASAAARATRSIAPLATGVATASGPLTTARPEVSLPGGASAAAAPAPGLSGGSDAPRVGTPVTAFDTLGAGWDDYRVAAVPEPGRAVVFASPRAGTPMAAFKAGTARSSRLACVSLADGSVLWSVAAGRGLVPARYARIVGADADGAGDTVVVVESEGPDVARRPLTVVVLGPAGAVVSSRRVPAGGAYLGAASGVVALRTAGAVGGYRSENLSQAVWTGPLPATGAPADLVLAAAGVPAYVWADGGYRDLATGRAAGFGADLPDSPGAAYRIVDGAVFETSPSGEGSAELVRWDPSKDAPAWKQQFVVDDFALAHMAVVGWTLAIGWTEPGTSGTQGVSAFSLETGGALWNRWCDGTGSGETAAEHPVGAAVALEAVAAAGSRIAMVCGTTAWLLNPASGAVAGGTRVVAGARASAYGTVDGVVVGTIDGVTALDEGGLDPVWRATRTTGVLTGAYLARVGVDFYLEAPGGADAGDGQAGFTAIAELTP